MIETLANAKIKPIVIGPMFLRGTFLALAMLISRTANCDVEISFHREIIPVLTQAGCNAGACHGSAAGRGNFRLSLFGSNGDADFIAISQQFEGRRLNRASPQRSLLLRKAIGEIDHGGGDVLQIDSRSYRLLSDWIEQGAKLDSRPTIEQLKIEAEEIVDATEKRNVTFQLRALAKFVDQKEIMDVTPRVQFAAVDPDTILIDTARGRFIKTRPGRHVIIARYMEKIEPFIVIEPYPNAVIENHGQDVNFVDSKISQRLNELRLDAGPIVSDAVFIRRVSLDLTGRLPTPDQVLNYVKDTSEDKRSRLIDRLLSSDAFVDYWTLIYSRWLHLHSLPNEKKGMEAMSSWIRSSIINSVSWADMTRQMVTGIGDSHTNGPANFCRMVGDARSHAELVGEVFLGVRLGCANCHDHPLDQWTQDDYHGLAAMLARIDRGRQVKILPRGDVTNPKTLSPAIRRLPGDRFLTIDEDSLTVLADWLTDSNQKRIAAPFVNRVWSQMFGRGLVDPVNDHRVTNPASHPELMQELIDRVVSENYSLRELLRWIANSNTYARQSRSTADESYTYQLSRPLDTHVLIDAINDVTGTVLRLEHRSLGTRAVEVVDPLEPAPVLDVLGRCRRVSGCEFSDGGLGLAGQLNLINGDFLNETLDTDEGELSKRLKAQQSITEIFEWFHLYALGEIPSETEIRIWSQELEAMDPEERRERLEDWLWSIFCSQRFQRNH